MLLYIIGHLYGHNFSENIYKKHKMKYISPNIWRLMYLIKNREVYHYNPKRIWNKSSHLPFMFLRHKVHIYSGKKWITKLVSRWLIGFRAGEFSWNRRLALYKAKQLRKKNKKLLKDKAKTDRVKSKLLGAKSSPSKVQKKSK